MKDLVVFDLDGTIANIDHRRHLVEGPNKDWDAFYAACVDDSVADGVQDVWQAVFTSPRQYVMWVVSGRSEVVRSETEDWLKAHKFTFHNLLMRPAGDYTPDEELKFEWMKPHQHRIAFVFDDRDKVVKMWRERLSVPCFQVADGDF